MSYGSILLANVGKWSWCEELGQLIAVFRTSSQHRERTGESFTAYTLPDLTDAIQERELELLFHGLDPSKDIDTTRAKATLAEYLGAAVRHSLEKDGYGHSTYFPID